jgi:D-glycero-D-manno-heptose 1,7-bisphosphate phosphatase
MVAHLNTTTDSRRPSQAVILAGGRGTRLLPLTETRPKPMIEFHGRPFLEYLIEQLKAQGFNRILLLLGYLPEVVQEYFGDGRRFGVSIEYSVTPVEDETGSRLRAARDQMDSLALLMYCDNYLPFSMDAMWSQWLARDPLALVTAYANEDGYTRSNLRIDFDGKIAVYDKSRTTSGLKGVDMGYMLMRREILDLMPEGNVSFEQTVYPKLIQQGRFYAHVTRHRYYSVGDHKRLPLTAEFLARKPTVLLDRDGVLNEKMPRADYVKTPSEWKWTSEALESLRLFVQRGFRTVVITNQPGIARGMMTEHDLAAIHTRMRNEALAAGGRIDEIYYCPHGWDDGCQCRKPAPGMLFAAQRDHHLDLSRCVYIGDDDRDRLAAEAAGCQFRMVEPGRPSLLEITREITAG